MGFRLVREGEGGGSDVDVLLNPGEEERAWRLHSCIFLGGYFGGRVDLLAPGSRRWQATGKPATGFTREAAPHRPIRASRTNRQNKSFVGGRLILLLMMGGPFPATLLILSVSTVYCLNLWSPFEFTISVTRLQGGGGVLRMDFKSTFWCILGGCICLLVSGGFCLGGWRSQRSI